MLPWIPMSRPGCVLSHATCSAGGCGIAVAFSHADPSGVEVITCLRTPLMKSAKGWTSDVGQYGDQ
jgi:hypothetical protein